MTAPDPAAPHAAAPHTPDQQTDQHPGQQTDQHPGQEPPRMPTAWEQMGGIGGILDSAIPVLLFVVVNAVADLRWAIIAALAAGAVIAVVRLLRKEPISQAVGGLFGVGIAAFIAARTGEAKGFFLLGIWSFVVYGGVLLLSILVRWPLIGVIWENLNGRGNAWRKDRRTVLRYDLATLLWVVVCAARFVVQRWLYDSDQVGWLAFARIAMGYPLFILAILGTVLIVTAGSGRTLRQQWADLREKRKHAPQAKPLTFRERYRLALAEQERRAASKREEPDPGTGG